MSSYSASPLLQSGILTSLLPKNPSVAPNMSTALTTPWFSAVFRPSLVSLSLKALIPEPVYAEFPLVLFEVLSPIFSKTDPKSSALLCEAIVANKTVNTIFFMITLPKLNVHLRFRSVHVLAFVLPLTF